jgi:hypothetical protein
MVKSSDGGQTWEEAFPAHIRGCRYMDSTYYPPLISDDEKTYLFRPVQRDRLAVMRKLTRKTPCEYLIENNVNSSTGLSNHDTFWNPNEYSVEGLSAKHVIDLGMTETASAKLQTDPNGSPADITGSVASEDGSPFEGRVSSDIFTMPMDMQEIDTHITDAPIHASRIIVQLEVTQPIEIPCAAIELMAWPPLIFPLKIPVPSASMALATLPPGYYIPPPVWAYPPTASLALLTRVAHHSWDIADVDRLTAQSIYLCTLTGDNDGVSDIDLPLSYFNAKLTDVFESYVLCVVPDVASYESEIVARKNGEIVIYSGYRTASGEELVEEIFRVPLAFMSIAKGGRSETITIFGWGVVPVGTPKERTARGVSRVTKQANGKRVIISEIDLFLRCGDVFIYGTSGNDYVQVGAIEYAADAPSNTTTMTVTEL